MTMSGYHYTESKHRHIRNAWDILVKLTSGKKTITYGEIADEVCAGDARSTTAFLDPIADYCWKNDLPPLTVLVVNKRSCKPSKSFNEKWLRPDESVESATAEVWDYDWSRHSPPMGVNDTANS